MPFGSHHMTLQTGHRQYRQVCSQAWRFRTRVLGLPETGELDSRRLGLAFLPDHHFIKKPAAASPPTIVTDADPVHPAKTHGLDEELIVLEVRERERAEG